MTALRRFAALLPAMAICVYAPLARGANPTPSSATWSFTDLDGDFNPDLVRSTILGSEGRGYTYSVEFKMSTGRVSTPIRVQARDSWGLQIVPRDVDGDHDLDLVVTNGAFGHAVAVWLNDGAGGFTSAGISQFPASIWLPDCGLNESRRTAPNDSSADLSPNPSALFNPGKLFDPADSTGSSGRSRDAHTSDSPSLDNARPRAPPAV